MPSRPDLFVVGSEETSVRHPLLKLLTDIPLLLQSSPSYSFYLLLLLLFKFILKPSQFVSVCFFVYLCIVFVTVPKFFLAHHSSAWFLCNCSVSQLIGYLCGSGVCLFKIFQAS